MLTGIRRGLTRFWYGPTGAPGATTLFPGEAEEEGWAQLEEEERLRQDYYWFYIREEEDKELEDDKYLY